MVRLCHYYIIIIIIILHSARIIEVEKKILPIHRVPLTNIITSSDSQTHEAYLFPLITVSLSCVCCYCYFRYRSMTMMIANMVKTTLYHKVALHFKQNPRLGNVLVSHRLWLTLHTYTLHRQVL